MLTVIRCQSIFCHSIVIDISLPDYYRVTVDSDYLEVYMYELIGATNIPRYVVAELPGERVYQQQSTNYANITLAQTQRKFVKI